MKTTHEEVRKLLSGGIKKTTVLHSEDKFFVMCYWGFNNGRLIVRYTRAGGLNRPEILRDTIQLGEGLPYEYTP